MTEKEFRDSLAAIKAYNAGNKDALQVRTVIARNVKPVQTDGCLNISPSDVARWFRLVFGEGDMFTAPAQRLTPLKLQKLLYYSQGETIRQYGVRLFSEPIFAYPYGPVVRSVLSEFEGRGYEDLAMSDGDYPEFPDEVERVLNYVFNVYGGMTASELVGKTHAKSPWKNTPERQEITIDALRDYFTR